MIYLLCSTIRPEEFRKTHQYWMERSVDKTEIKTKVVVDTQGQAEQLCDFDVLVYPHKNVGITKPLTYLTQSLVDLKDEDIIVVMSDDFFAPKDWDVFLKKQFNGFNGAINVYDGNSEEAQNVIVAIPIMTYACLKRLNRIVYHPLYTHSFSDNELYDILTEWKVLKKIKATDGYTFEHRHWSFGKRNKDANDLSMSIFENDKEKYASRKRLSIDRKLELSEYNIPDPLIDCDFFDGLSDISFGDPYKGFRRIDENEIKTLTDRKYYITISINTERLIELLGVVGRMPQSIFTIVAINSDLNVDEKIIAIIPQNVKTVWCQNYNGTEQSNIRSIPGGLERRLWFPAEKKQFKLKNAMYFVSNTSPEMGAYLNVNTNTNIRRKKIVDSLANKPFIRTELLGNGNSYDNYIVNLLKYKFIISPPGNGIDCHRTWEALYLNRIPVLEKNKFNENVYGDMPAMMVDDYSTLTEEMMCDFLKNELPKKKTDKLCPEYWRSLIKGNQR